MTIGIYALYWEEQDLIYIGQSQNISSRFKEHCSKLSKNTHTNYKVQNAFNSYGLPELLVLEECGIEQLNELEIVWTKEFDSINNGLNIIEAGQVGWGVNSNASKYTKWQSLKVFSLLYKTKLSITDISKRCGIPYTSVQDIKNQKAHFWLKQAYPHKYMQMISNTYCRSTSIKGKKLKHHLYGDIVLNSMQEFWSKYFPDKKYSSVREGISRVIKGKNYQYFGFTL